MTDTQQQGTKELRPVSGTLRERKQAVALIAPPDGAGPSQAEKLPCDPLVPTIFHEPWWLDIVTGGQYGVAEMREHGKVVGQLPYFLRKRLGITYSMLPPMTHFLGPAIVEGDGPPATRFLRRLNVTRELIRQLPPASVYRYKCHRDITDTLAFQQERFMTAVQYTHEIAPDTVDNLWKNLRSEKRKKIRQAERVLTVEDIVDPGEFWRLYDTNLRKRNITNICDERMCSTLVAACLERNRGRIHAVRDQNKTIVAAVFCIWDATASYYFMSTRTDGAHHGAISLLAWEGMKDAAALGLIFDLDGVYNAKSVLFFTEFGGVVQPRYIVTRATGAGGLALAARDMFRGNRFFFS